MGPKEKRSAPRISVKLTGHCQIGKKYVRDAIVDLSEGGFYLHTRETAKEGAPVRVAIALPYLEGPRFCTLVGNVARVDKNSKGVTTGLGISLSSEQIALLDKRTLAGFIESR